ncbi:LCP family protein [Garicola koreensis]|uniref:LCP family protein required for cell wall assembly n=1 Tax=Garicola koreensis TaxID=1262554 RepID=A0A7W5TQ26_9MICC|nr:LCP family protein required for cell wall assembly [Garicola koreensis]
MTTPTISYHQFRAEHDVVRDPRRASQRDRSRRAVILTLLTLFLPGGAQTTAGSRKLGRFALAVTIGCWFVLLLGLIMFFTLRSVLLSALTQPFLMWVGSVVLAALAIGWLILWVDTLRLIRFTTLAPGFKPIIGVALVLATLLTSGGLGYGAYLLNESRQALAGIFSGGPAIDAAEGRYNFLLMGADAGEGRQGLRPDSIHVISVNESSAETIIFSIPRNFQNAQFAADSPLNEVYPNGYNCGNDCIINFLYTETQNNYAHLYPDAQDPGAAAMMDAAAGTLDMTMHGYVMVDMAGFSELIDAMGGVTVESGGWVPYRGQRPDGSGWGDTWFEPGVHTFDGDEALAFARSRDHSSDFNRIQRQQCIQQAMIAQFTPQTLLTRFTDIMAAGENLVETDLPQSQLGSLMNLAAEAQEHDPQRLTLGAPDFGSAGDNFSTYPDFEQIRARVDELLANEEANEDQDDDAQESPAQAQDEADTESETDQSSEDSPAGPTPDQDDPAVSDDEPEVETPAEPSELTQPDGSPLTVEYLIAAEDRGETGILQEAASTNGECSPAQ